jgi:hypothetical protein
LWLLSPAGLRLEISCETHKKKMNLIFDFDKKIFLTGKMSTRVGVKTEQCVEKNSRNPNRYHSKSPRQTDFVADCLRIAS